MPQWIYRRTRRITNQHLALSLAAVIAGAGMIQSFMALLGMMPPR